LLAPAAVPLPNGRCPDGDVTFYLDLDSNSEELDQRRPTLYRTKRVSLYCGRFNQEELR